MRLLAVPVATYRIQFSLNFRFIDARNLVPYLHELGITHLYASPRFKAGKGSSHGYDVADPMRINSELGTEEEFDELVRKLKSYGMGLLLDIVPNHMVASSENPWWMDVLENGTASKYATYFDIDWHPATGKAEFLQDNKVLLPVLGDLYGNVLEAQELNLKLDENGFYIQYYEHRFPLNPSTYRPILEHCLETARTLRNGDSSVIEETSHVLDAIKRLSTHKTSDQRRIEGRYEAHKWIKHRLWELYHHSPELKKCMDETLRFFNGIQCDVKSFDPLDRLLSDQAYRLAYWKMSAEEINYRRFFDINELVGLRVEDPRVFDDRHRSIAELTTKEDVIALRVDHVDGLYDPPRYLERLQAAVSSENGNRNTLSRYIVVEKILGRDEPLPGDWPVAGTTGYDFLNAVNGLFVNPEGLHALERDYHRITGCELSYLDVCYTRNKLVIQQLFAGELAGFTHSLGRLAAQDRHARDLPLPELAQAFVEVTACLPVYRTYIRSFNISDRDRGYLEWTLNAARGRTSREAIGDAAFDFLRRVLLLDPPPYAVAQRKAWLRFILQWQQFTGPVMAKGLEDTASYVYNCLVSLNEVGGDSLREKPPCDVQAFHAFNQERLTKWPHTMNATSTHDTKRSEDVRARINVLSEIVKVWLPRLHRWNKWNRPYKTVLYGRPVPDANEESLLYQMMLGAWPLDAAEEPDFVERIVAFMLKALREAKVHTNWINPDPRYESAVESFMRRITGGDGKNRFMEEFHDLRKRVAFWGYLNALAQILLKITSPGIPDFYQGSELWDFNMVDPDNRRPVDFATRVRLLDELKLRETEGLGALLKDLVSNWQDGRIKLYLIRKALNFRLAHHNLFAEGEYIPLEGTGRGKDLVVAFARRQKKQWTIVAVPRLSRRLLKRQKSSSARNAWPALKIALPEECPGMWRNVFTNETVASKRAAGGQSTIMLSRMLRTFPSILLEAVPE